MRENPFQNKTVGQMLDETAARYPDREAVVFRDARITYREFQRHAERLARGLLALGIKKDDKVALWLPTRPAWLGSQYACASRRFTNSGCSNTLSGWGADWLHLYHP